MDAPTARLLVSAGLALLGIALLAYAAWARHGGSPAARAWMGTEFGARTVDERMTLLGLPAIGVLCLCGAMATLPVVGKYLLLLAVPLGFLALVVLLLALLQFIPLPAFLYPAWAKPLRLRNQAAEKTIPAALRRR